MKIDKMKKEDLELLSYKDITMLILEESSAMNTLDLFTKIVNLLGLPKSTIDKKIGDYYTTLTTDKNFLLIDGKWDLRKRHTSDKVVKAQDQDDEDEEEEIEEKIEPIEDEDDFDSQAVSDDEDFDDGDDDLKDLVVLDEEELELEQ